MCFKRQKPGNPSEMNSPPLSLSIPSMGNGRFSLVCAICSLTQRWTLFKRVHSSVQPEPALVKVKVWQNWPQARASQWQRTKARPIKLKKPGRLSFRLKQTRIGIRLLRKLAGLVVRMPLKRTYFTLRSNPPFSKKSLGACRT